ncbi:hypothetical protein GOODEAATRI_008695, partial [Goodea atripinnis]
FVTAPEKKYGEPKKLTVTVEELQPIMNAIVGLFPRRFLEKQTRRQREVVRANKPCPPSPPGALYSGSTA